MQPEKQMEGSVLKTTTVHQLIANKGRLIEVPYTASVGDTLNALLAHNITAVPVAAPPGHWIGAGGSMILESDKATGMVRKHYIGIVSVLDVMIHLAELENNIDIEDLRTTPVSTIIGHCLEGLSLWTISPNTSVYEAIEPMSKGIHRVLVPIESQMEHVTGVELAESSPGYRMLTQTDIVRFLHIFSQDICSITSSSIESLGAAQQQIFALPANMPVTDAVRCMRNASLTAVAIVEPDLDADTEPMLAIGKGRRLVGTFSASDLRGCSSEALRSWAPLSVLEFVRKTHLARRYGVGAAMAPIAGVTEVEALPLVTCLLRSTLEEVMRKVVERRVHRVWVTDEGGCLLGLVSLSDILRVVRTLTSTCAVPATTATMS